jgi:hypothetical protein
MVASLTSMKETVSLILTAPEGVARIAPGKRNEQVLRRWKFKTVYRLTTTLLKLSVGLTIWLLATLVKRL